MKNITKILSAAVLLLVSVTVSAHPTDSLTRDTINGKIVYKYQVKKSEGLYRISKNFGVSQEDILSLNPTLKNEGLKLGQTIYIPAVEPFDSSQYVVHTLEPKETLYGLSRRYGVSQKDIERLNPQTVKRMEIGATLLIKKKTVEAPAAQPATISEQTETTTRAEISDNSDYSENSEISEISEKSENSENAEKSENSENSATDSIVISALPIRLAFMLPFMTDAPKRDANIDRFVDFYEGALIAIYEAQQQGQRFEIYTYDVQKSDLAVQQVLGRGELQMMDAIIGPAYPAQVSYATLFAKQNKIQLLVPFTQKVNGIEHTPTVMQFNPSPEMSAQVLVDTLAKRREDIRFVLVDANDKDIPQSVKAVHQALSDTVFEITNTSIKDILNDSLGLSLSKERENIIVFNSEKYSSIQVLMPKLLQFAASYRITLYGHYSWQSEKIELPIIYTGVFHAMEPALKGHFETLHHHYFAHDISSTLPRFDLLGYDLTRALIMQLQQCTRQPNEQLTEECMSARIKGIQSDVMFRRVSEQGGRINAAVNVLRTDKEP